MPIGNYKIKLNPSVELGEDPSDKCYCYLYDNIKKCPVDNYNIILESQIINITYITDYSFCIAISKNYDIPTNFTIKPEILIASESNDDNYENYKGLSYILPLQNRLIGLPLDPQKEYATDDYTYLMQDNTPLICDTIDLKAQTYTQRIAIVNGKDVGYYHYSGWNEHIFSLGKLPSSGSIPKPKPKPANKNGYPILSTVYEGKLNLNLNIVGNGQCYISDHIYIRDDSITATSSNNNWWPKDDIYFIYPLDNPVTTKLSSEQIAILSSIKSFKDKTYIYSNASIIEALFAGKNKAYVNTDSKNKLIEYTSNIDGLRQTTAPFVYVLNNNTRVCDLGDASAHDYSIYSNNEENFSLNHGGCWYWTHSNNYGGQINNEEGGGYKRLNGTVMFAMPDQGNRNAKNTNLSSIFDTIASYYSRPNMFYAARGLFDSDCSFLSSEEIAKYYGNSFVAQWGPNNMFSQSYGIECASFVQAVLQGISYENSRYVLGNDAKNIPSTHSAIRLPSTRGENCLYLEELVEYFAENKQLFTIKKDPTGTVKGLAYYNGLQPGDILFSCSPESTDEKERFKNYYAVDHVCIILQVWPEENSILIAEGGGSGLAKLSHSALYNSEYGHIFHNKNVEPLCPVKVDHIEFDNFVGKKFFIFARPEYGTSRMPKDISGYVRLFSNTDGNNFLDPSVESYEGINVPPPCDTAITEDDILPPDSDITLKRGITFSRLGFITPTGRMKGNHCYTITLKGQLPKWSEQGDPYILATINYRDLPGTTNTPIESSIEYQFAYRVNIIDNKISFPLFIPPINENKEIRIISFYIAWDKYKSYNNLEYKIEEIALIDGFSYNENGSKPLELQISSEINLTGFYNYSYIKNNKTYINLGFNKDNLNNDTLIGHLNTQERGFYFDSPQYIYGMMLNLYPVQLRILPNGDVRFTYTSTTSTSPAYCRFKGEF